MPNYQFQQIFVIFIGNHAILLLMSDTFFEPDVQKRFSELMFLNQENEIRHNPYDEEQREFNAIEQGDLLQLKKSIEEKYHGKIGKLARDPVRQAQNLAIVIITLASRAAMRGGLDPEIAYSLSDSYIQKVEEFHTKKNLEQLMRHAEIQYTQMVHEILQRKKNKNFKLYLKQKNPKIDECRNYIVTHLNKKLTVKIIANKLEINPNYLSELFIHHEKISLTEFILQERIRVAKNLLLYSAYSCIDISEYLCFTSQSYFGQRFKKVTGMTPKEYRNKYGKKEYS